MAHFYKRLNMCGAVNYSLSFCAALLNETKPKEAESTYTGFLIRAKAEVAKANPKVPRSQTECPCPNPPHLGPTMELHLVIVSKADLYCLL